MILRPQLIGSYVSIPQAVLPSCNQSYTLLFADNQSLFQYRKRYYPVATFVGKTGRHDMHAGGLFQYRKR